MSSTWLFWNLQHIDVLFSCQVMNSKWAVSFSKKNCACNFVCIALSFYFLFASLKKSFLTCTLPSPINFYCNMYSLFSELPIVISQCDVSIYAFMHGKDEAMFHIQSHIRIDRITYQIYDISYPFKLKQSVNLKERLNACCILIMIIVCWVVFYICWKKKKMKVTLRLIGCFVCRIWPQTNSRTVSLVTFFYWHYLAVRKEKC